MSFSLIFQGIVAVEPLPENLRLNRIRNIKVVKKAVSSLRDKTVPSGEPLQLEHGL